MAKLSQSIVIVGAKRTAFGALTGMLKAQSATELAAHASLAALAQAGVSPSEIGHVIVGNVQQTSPDAIYCARHVGLKAGVPMEVPALTVNRLCGSGFQAVISAAEQLLLGEAEVVLAAGTENMSQAPHVIRGAREGVRLRQGAGHRGLAVELAHGQLLQRAHGDDRREPRGEIRHLACGLR